MPDKLIYGPRHNNFQTLQQNWIQEHINGISDEQITIYMTCAIYYCIDSLLIARRFHSLLSLSLWRNGLAWQFVAKLHPKWYTKVIYFTTGLVTQKYSMILTDRNITKGSPAQVALFCKPDENTVDDSLYSKIVYKQMFRHKYSK